MIRDILVYLLRTRVLLPTRCHCGSYGIDLSVEVRGE